jgi:hypothetical protein
MAKVKRALVREQSIPNGTKVVFHFHGMEEEFEACGDDLRSIDDGKEFIIDSLDVATELGEQDYEYYNLTDPNEPERELSGISRYHLQTID